MELPVSNKESQVAECQQNSMELPVAKGLGLQNASAGRYFTTLFL